MIERTEDDEMLLDIKQQMLELRDQIRTAIVRNLMTIDEEGYCFLTNQPIGKTIPLEFAISCGFKHPEFKIKDEATTQEGKILPDHEAIWVKEGEVTA